MKFEWEPQDVRPGRRVKPKAANEEWMICYDAERTSEESYWGLVSLSDGMISVQRMSTYDMRDHLNKSGLRPLSII